MARTDLQQHLGAPPGRSKGKVEAHGGDPGQGQGPHGDILVGRGAAGQQSDNGHGYYIYAKVLVESGQ